MEARHLLARAYKDRRVGHISTCDLTSGVSYSDEYVSLIVRMGRSGGQVTNPRKEDWSIEVEHIQTGGHWDFSTVPALEQFLVAFLHNLDSPHG